MMMATTTVMRQTARMANKEKTTRMLVVKERTIAIQTIVRVMVKMKVNLKIQAQITVQIIILADPLLIQTELIIQMTKNSLKSSMSV